MGMLPEWMDWRMVLGNHAGDEVIVSLSYRGVEMRVMGILEEYSPGRWMVRNEEGRSTFRGEDVSHVSGTNGFPAVVTLAG